MSPPRIGRRAVLSGALLGAASVPLLASSALADPGTNATPKIYIDPGHGGSESGAVGNGLVEKDITLDIALRTRDALQANYTADIRMSRTSDVYRSLSYRSSDANNWGADLFVSIHINAGGGTGFETFRHPYAPGSTATIQRIMHDEIVVAMRGDAPTVDRGKKTANFHVLRETYMHAVLTESLFIDHSGDAARLATSEFRQAAAEGHALGIAAAMGL